MDKYTYGKNTCFVILAQLMDECPNKNITELISRNLESFRVTLHELLRLNRSQNWATHAALHTWLQALDSRKDVSPKLISFYKCCIRAIWRKHVYPHRELERVHRAS